VPKIKLFVLDQLGTTRTDLFRDVNVQFRREYFSNT